MAVTPVYPEVVFDESGSDGENLATATNAVYSHGSVVLAEGEAAQFMSDLRQRIGFGSGELKSNAALRAESLPDLLALAREYELHKDRANIYLAEKSYFLAGKMVSLLIEEEAYGRGAPLGPSLERELAERLADGAAASIGQHRWAALLVAFNRVIRRPPSRQRVYPQAQELTSRFFDTLDAARKASVDPGVTEVLDLLWDARAHAAQYAGAPDNILRELDPTVPSLVAECGTWSLRLDGSPFTVIHDEHWSLNPEALAMAQLAAGLNQMLPGGDVRAITLGDSKHDPRIQVADIVAGMGRLAGELTLSGVSESPIHEVVLPLIDYNMMHAPSSPLKQLFDPQQAGYLQRYVAAVRASGGLGPQ